LLHKWASTKTRFAADFLRTLAGKHIRKKTSPGILPPGV
jgi:hypothetical protein